MSIGSAIVNQALSRGATHLKKVMGNLPGAALSSSKSAFGSSLTRGDSINLQYPMNVENDIPQGHYIMFFVIRVLISSLAFQILPSNIFVSIWMINCLSQIMLLQPMKAILLL